MSGAESPESPLLADLRARGLVHQITAEGPLGGHLAESRNVYCGFDPTRDSLTIGNLVGLLLLRRFQLAGHRPIVLMGGGTGLIGDPSGKDAERTLQSREAIQANVDGQRRIFEGVLDFEGAHAAVLVNNADWLGQVSYLDMLRDVGKHFSVNMMIQKDSVKARLTERDQGISYTEFSYMILQAYDYAHLFKSHNVTLQTGGSDQWGNIVAGVDLTRRLHGAEVFGLTTPLLTKSDGGKFGKTETGAIWLTADRTSPYAFYQFWLNTADDDISRFVRVFSLRPLPEVELVLAEHLADPAKRSAQRFLARELTALLHGEAGLRDAEAATEALFSGDVRALRADLLEQAFEGAPVATLGPEVLQGRPSVVDVLVLVGAAKSKREARQFLESGAISVNGERQGPDGALGPEHLLHGRYLLIRRGKKTWHVCKVFSPVEVC